MQAALLCIQTSLKLYFQSLPLQLLRKKIHKSPDFRADCIVAVIDGVKRFGFVQGAVGQEFVQVSRSNIGGDGEIRQAGDAVAFQAQAADGFAAVGGQLRHGGVGRVAGVGKRPVVQGFGLGEADEGVLRQVGDSLGRAVTGEIIGRGNEFQTAVKQMAGAQGGVVQAAFPTSAFTPPFLATCPKPLYHSNY